MNVRRPLQVAALLGALLVGAACEPTPTAPIGGKGITATPAPAQYKIARTNADGTATRWNPCAPIRYVVSMVHAPSFAMAEVNAAVAAIESASGLDLVFAGTTTERPVPHRPLRDPARYGTGWAPILISFATDAELPFGSPTASGWGQAIPATGAAEQYVTGQVVLRPDHGWTAGTASKNPLSIMLRHELGHVLGLAHVPVPTEIMGTAGNGSARAWGPGDRAGLAKVGRPAGCLPLRP